MLSFPNPFQEQLNIELQTVDGERVDLEIINVEGRVVKHLMVNQYLSEGVHQFTFSIENLVDGIYFLKFTVANRIKTVKLIKTSF